ncbi:MAG: hypothetical protein Q9169_005160 [Polycauliona sp. 2 TL-2023]
MPLPPSYTFGIVAGGIFIFILLCGAIGAIQRYIQNRRLDRDLEANRSLPEAEARKAMTSAEDDPTMVVPEMAHVRSEARIGMGGQFVEIDLGDSERGRRLFEKGRGRV